MAKISERKSTSSNNARDHLANERTFLSWIRTSIGIMAFGFVVEKFAIFVKQFGYFLISQGYSKSMELSPEHQTYSSIFGIFLVAFGSLMVLFAFLKYKKNERQIDEDSYHHSSTLAIVVTSLVFVMGIFLVVYLMKT